MASAKLLPKSSNPNARKPWTVRYWDDSGQHQVSFTTKEEANARIARITNDARDYSGYVNPKLANVSFTDEAALWISRLPGTESSREGYRSTLNKWVVPWAGNRKLSQVASDRDGLINLLTVIMATMSYSRRKITRHLIVGTLDEAVRAGKIAKHRCEGIRVANNATEVDRSSFVFPTHSQITALAEEMPNNTGLAIWLMRGCGLRIEEALAVQKSDFRENGTVLRVTRQASQDGRNTLPLKHRKAGDYRDIPVPAYLWEMVKDLPEGCVVGGSERPMYTYDQVYSPFMREAKKIGIPEGFTPHSLRHAFVSALLSHGVPITDVAQWLGHRNINVTFATYGHLVPSAASKARCVLDAEYAEWSESDQ
jgi:integrase